MKHFTNRYMLLYSLALVAVLAVVLSVTAVALKPREERNRQIEQQQMILKTIGLECAKSETAQAYDRHITEAQCDGQTYYRYDCDGRQGIILPLHGTGLWGPIWGYLALDCSDNVVGAVFDHKGETPGLGGEIATDKFAQRFVGKCMDEHPIYLIKNADKKNPYQVDAISGGTMTSNGVTQMLEEGYFDYVKIKENTAK
ncbi:MAG: FMN-binding protein [Bacteroidales bacterium]|nr:FMN-binding protein [Bacteroidales bacterium]